MSMEKSFERIALNKFLGKDSTQVLLEGDIIVPDVKPDIGRVVRAESRAVISKIEATAGRADYLGALNISILYLDALMGVHTLSIAAPIEDNIAIDGLGRDSWVNILPTIEHFDHWVTNDRKMGYRAVIEIKYSAMEQKSIEVVSGISGLPASQIRRVNLSALRVVDKRIDNFPIKDELVIPSNKPNIREILQFNTSIANKEIRVAQGRLGISGDLGITVLYRGETEGVVEFEEFSLPFNGTIDMPKAADGQFADCLLNVVNVSLRPRPDEDGEDRVLVLDVQVAADVTLTAVDNIETLDDAYCLNKDLVFTRENVNLSRLICRSRSSANVKEALQIEDAPPILRILKVDGRIQLDELKLLDDKAAAEGIILADILYVADNDDAPIHSHQAMIPFRQVMEIRGAAAGMDCDLTHAIDHIGFNLLGAAEIELRFALSFAAAVQKSITAQLITDIEFNDLSRETIDAMPSMAIVSIDHSDSLWSIAKKYNANLDELMQINEIAQPEDLQVGAKILVVKSVS